jgi:hypothetical protein
LLCATDELDCLGEILRWRNRGTALSQPEGGLGLVVPHPSLELRLAGKTQGGANQVLAVRRDYLRLQRLALRHIPDKDPAGVGQEVRGQLGDDVSRRGAVVVSQCRAPLAQHLRQLKALFEGHPSHADDIGSVLERKTTLGGEVEVVEHDLVGGAFDQSYAVSQDGSESVKAGLLLEEPNRFFREVSDRSDRPAADQSQSIQAEPVEDEGTVRGDE